MNDRDAYQPFDQDEKLGPPPWPDGPSLTAWEDAHGHDVRLKCYVEFGCQVIVTSLEAERDALNDEVDRLKANQMPDGGEWRTEYGQFDVDFGETVFFERTHKEPSRSDDMKRRVWYGPAEPIAEENDNQ